MQVGITLPTRAVVFGATSVDELLETASDADASGWDEDSYGEVPAPDMQPILTPWTEQKAVVYRFEGNTAVGPEPATGGKAGVRRR